jgi:uncharacterized membrane protein
VFKIACCGSPLLILLVASGAVAVVDLALGVAAVALVVLGWTLWRRRRACACEVPQAAIDGQPAPEGASPARVNGDDRIAGRDSRRQKPRT